jgi:hypothetical protein
VYVQEHPRMSVMGTCSRDTFIRQMLVLLVHHVLTYPGLSCLPVARGLRAT